MKWHKTDAYFELTANVMIKGFETELAEGDRSWDYMHEFDPWDWYEEGDEYNKTFVFSSRRIESNELVYPSFSVAN